MHMSPPPITLRQLSADDLPALQALYEASEGYFRKHTGATVRPEQAAFDYGAVLESGDRVLLGIWWERKRLVGRFDLRFHHPEPGVIWFGALILQDDPPMERLALKTWAVRILEEWLRIDAQMREIRLALLASDAASIRFWTHMGYVATPHSTRRRIGGRLLRLLIYKKSIPRLA